MMTTLDRIRQVEARRMARKRERDQAYRAVPHCDFCKTVERLERELAQALAKLAKLSEYTRREQDEREALDRRADAQLLEQPGKSKTKLCMACTHGHYVQLDQQGWYCFFYNEFSEGYCEVNEKEGKP